MMIIVLGVSGSGKTAVGSLLASKLGLVFHDGDDYHPRCNVAKMTRGIPLSDEDRMPWLRSLASEIPLWEAQGGAVLACSALKDSYRRILAQAGNVRFVYLKGPFELIRERLREREEHYMPLKLLQSQFDALEEPVDAMVVDISGSPEAIADEILRHL